MRSLFLALILLLLLLPGPASAIGLGPANCAWPYCAAGWTQEATDCSGVTAEGIGCWEQDADQLWIGDGTAAVSIGGDDGMLKSVYDPGGTANQVDIAEIAKGFNNDPVNDSWNEIRLTSVGIEIDADDDNTTEVLISGNSGIAPVGMYLSTSSIGMTESDMPVKTPFYSDCLSMDTEDMFYDEDCDETKGSGDGGLKCNQVISLRINPDETGGAEYINLIDNTVGAEASEDWWMAPVEVIFSDIRVEVDVAPGAGNDDWRVTISDDAAGTATGCDVADAATNCTDADESIVAIGSKVTVEVDDIGGVAPPAAAAEMLISFCVTPD